MKKLTAEWVRKAEADVRAAQELLSGKPPLTDSAAFHCQQAVEKYMKALLQERNAAIPKIHSLEKLLTLLSPHTTALEKFRRPLKALTKYAVEYRYPGIHASARQARSALRWTLTMREVARNVLGIRARRPGKKKQKDENP